MEPTLSLTNARKSMMKYFWDELKVSRNKQVIYDKWIAEGFTEGRQAGEWVSINFNEPSVGRVSTMDVIIFCCAINDPEGMKVSKLQDIIIEILSSLEADRKVVEFYDTTTNPWTEVGGLTFFFMPSGNEIVQSDDINIGVLNVKAKWGAKI